MSRERIATPITVDPCGWCGRGYPDAVVISVDCGVPTLETLRGDPIYAARCVTAPRFRWCARFEFFAACLADGGPPQSIPGVTFPGLPPSE